jgi:hypothetical protein
MFKEPGANHSCILVQLAFVGKILQLPAFACKNLKKKTCFTFKVQTVSELLEKIGLAN